MHWTNAAAMVVLIGSGWGIYDDSVIIHGIRRPFRMHRLPWSAGLEKCRIYQISICDILII